MIKFYAPIKEYVDFVEKNKEDWQNCKSFIILLPSSPTFHKIIIGIIEKKYGCNPNCCWELW